MAIICRRLCALVLVLLVPVAIFPQLSFGANGENFDVIVVTATRIPTPVAQVASSISIVTADEIAARQYLTLPDVLKEAPGLNLVQTGGPGGQTSIFMRGTNSNHTKVLVDGIDVGDPSNLNGAFDFGHFPAADIARVEILRGPQSGLYGSDAIGGVINIVTKAGSGPAQFTISAEGGSFDTFNQTAGLSGSADGFHYSANIEHVHVGATPVTPLDLLAPGERRIDDYYDNLTGSTKLGWDISDHWDIGLVGRYTDSHLRLTGDNYLTAAPDTTQSHNNTQQYHGRLTVHGAAFDGALDQTFGVAYGHTKAYDTSPDYAESDTFGHRLKADWQGNIRLATDQTLVLGAEHQRDSISQPIEADTTINSGYAELQSKITSQFFSALSARYDTNSQFGDKVTYRVAPTYVIDATGTKIKASVGSGFKAPTLQELYVSYGPNSPANPNLKPESSLGYDVGIEQSLVENSVRVGITYFHNNIRNLISYFTNNITGIGMEINVGRSVTEGVESFLSYRPISSLVLRVDYTYTEALDETPFLIDFAPRELLRRPKQKFSARADWEPTSRWSINAALLYEGRWEDIGREDFTYLSAPGYTIVNLSTAYTLSDRWTVYGRVNNLLDRRYENPSGFLQPRVGAFAGIRAKF